MARRGIRSAGTWDLLVNATPVGTWPAVEAAPVQPAVLSGGRIVYDLVYNPRRTALLRAGGSRRDACAIGGLEMLDCAGGEAVRVVDGDDRRRAP